MTPLITSKCTGIFSEFIPNNTITCNNRDPPWMTPSFKSAIKRKHRIYKKYISVDANQMIENMWVLFRNQTSPKITQAKDEYFSSFGKKKLSHPVHGTKCYWTTLNKIMDTKKIFQYTTFTNFQTKANIFNNYFVEQCSLISNDSVLPISVSRCNSSLSSTRGVNFCMQSVGKITIFLGKYFYFLGLGKNSETSGQR